MVAEAIEEGFSEEISPCCAVGVIAGHADVGLGMWVWEFGCERTHEGDAKQRVRTDCGVFRAFRHLNSGHPKTWVNHLHAQQVDLHLNVFMPSAHVK